MREILIGFIMAMVAFILGFVVGRVTLIDKMPTQQKPNESIWFTDSFTTRSAPPETLVIRRRGVDVYFREMKLGNLYADTVFTTVIVSPKWKNSRFTIIPIAPTENK